MGLRKLASIFCRKSLLAPYNPQFFPLRGQEISANASIIPICFRLRGRKYLRTHREMANGGANILRRNTIRHTTCRVPILRMREAFFAKAFPAHSLRIPCAFTAHFCAIFCILWNAECIRLHPRAQGLFCEVHSRAFLSIVCAFLAH